MSEEEIIKYLEIKNAVTKKQIEDGEIFLNVEEWKKEIQAIQRFIRFIQQRKRKEGYITAVV